MSTNLRKPLCSILVQLCHSSDASDYVVGSHSLSEHHPIFKIRLRKHHHSWSGWGHLVAFLENVWMKTGLMMMTSITRIIIIITMITICDPDIKEATLSIQFMDNHISLLQREIWFSQKINWYWGIFETSNRKTAWAVSSSIGYILSAHRQADTVNL